ATQCTALRLPDLETDEQPPPVKRLRVWKSRNDWDAQRAAYLEAAGAVVATAMPSISEQYEIIRGESRQHLKTLAERMQEIAPPHLRDVIASSMADELQLSSARILALYDARLEILWSRMETTESRQTWQQVCTEVAFLKQAMAEGDTTDISLSLRRLTALTSKGDRNEHNWEQIDEWANRRATIAKQEAERLKLGQSYLDVQQAMAIASDKITKIVALIKRYGSPELVSRVREHLSGTTA
ncbi:MAG: hypothetical protein AAFO83_01700, partial [Cyanobacteria bacterium J06607_13]